MDNTRCSCWYDCCETGTRNEFNDNILCRDMIPIITGLKYGSMTMSKSLNDNNEVSLPRDIIKMIFKMNYPSLIL